MSVVVSGKFHETAVASYFFWYCQVRKGAGQLAKLATHETRKNKISSHTLTEKMRLKLAL